ncbi:hypothetical protein CSQ96_17920 [Janthinobacterium sp. BJB412]|nr:hypothetical protein CSQ96_17920 [Janthinobacterium sp. BJB412]
MLALAAWIVVPARLGMPMLKGRFAAPGLLAGADAVYFPVAADFLVKKTFRHYHLSSDFIAWLTSKHVMGE